MSSGQRNKKAYYPVFLDLQGRRCVVVGGGVVAQRKVTTLLRYGADVAVISPAVTRRLATDARQGKIRYLARRFRPTDLRGAWLVYAATDDEVINELTSRTAATRGVFANIVDQPRLCSFIAPAQVKQGDLVLAISTGGGSPALAKRLRKDLQRTVGSQYSRMLQLLKQLRPLAQQKLSTPAQRKRYFKHLLNGDVFELVKQGRLQQAHRQALVMLADEANHSRL